jgi:hypothetical protein
MSDPIYELISIDEEIAGYYRGKPIPSELIFAEDVWLPDGSRPQPGDPLPEGLILSTHYVDLIEPGQEPEFMREGVAGS